VGPWAVLEGVRKISSPPGFDPRTVQSLASRYTDWVIPTHVALITKLYLNLSCSSDVVTHDELGMWKLMVDKSFVLKK
jgi:hypothetical protein